MRLPFLRPNPARLSGLRDELHAIESSGLFSNYGPVNSRFEAAMTERMFGGAGGCLTVNNATIGLMLAIREAAGDPRASKRRYALMPSFTFAATAHAALWAGFTPLFCDIDPDTWLSSADSEDELLAKHSDEVAVIVPYATFGNCLDLGRYQALAERHGAGVVVDAAASLGSLDTDGRGFGAGFPHAVVYSMHVTKTFSTAEAGLIHCGDAGRLSRLRTMGNFGFGIPRTATMPGLNSKLSEVGALLAASKLDAFEPVVARRERLAETYRRGLPKDWQVQSIVGARIAYQFMPALLPDGQAANRAKVLARLSAAGVGSATYFSPHLAEHPYFSDTCVAGDLSVTGRIASRIVSLPMSDLMSDQDAESVCGLLATSDNRSEN